MTTQGKREALKAILKGEKSVQDLKPELNYNRLHTAEKWLLYLLKTVNGEKPQMSKEDNAAINFEPFNSFADYLYRVARTRPAPVWEVRGYWRANETETEAYKEYFRQHCNLKEVLQWYTSFNMPTYQIEKFSNDNNR